jgi:hypothetical protein
VSQAVTFERGAAPAKKFPNLRSLYFDGDRLTDAHVKVLSELGGLTELNLKGSAITDEGAKHLTALKRLKALDLSETQVTTEGSSNWRPCRTSTRSPSGSRAARRSVSNRSLSPTS